MTQTTASILVVDVNADERAPFVAGLHGQGFTIDFARSGDEALQSIRRGDFDLVLLDATVPPLGGFEVLRSIRAQHGVLLLPVILILERDDTEHASAALDAGANDYIVRPIDCSLLQARIRARLTRTHAARDLEHITRTLQSTVHKKIGEIERTAAFLNAVLDNIQDAVVACDEDGYLTLFNKAAREMHGLPEQASPPETWADHYHLCLADGVTPMKTDEVPLFRALQGKRVHRQEVVIARQDGTEIVGMASGQSMIDKKGDKLGAVVSIHDVTAQKRAEAALLESEERFRGAFETATHGMALVAPDGHWLKVNRALCELVGYDEQELLSLDFQTITHREDLDTDLEHVQAVLDGKIRSYQMEKRYIRKDGQIVWILLSVSLVRDARGNPLHFVVQIFDLTERKATEAQLLQAQKMQALGRLTGGVAHDFNNLLTVILGNARLLERRLADDPVVNRQTAAIVDAARRGSDLTQRLLVFSRRGHLEPKNVDGKKLVCRLLDLLRRALGETIQVETQFGNGEFIVFVDPNQLEAAVLNLATNARDAMPDGGRLTIGLETVAVDEHASELACRLKPGAYVMLSVKDSGCGIPAAELDRIFEPFFTTKEVGKGTGLGLSMVFGFAQQSGGYMEVDSQVQRGTTFRLYLPRADKPAQSCDVVDGAEIVDASGRESIMVVEDEPSVRRLAATWLTDMGYQVIEAENGPEALNKLEQHPDVDLLFTDIVMPGGMTGYELAERARQYISELKVLFTSGYALAAANPGSSRQKEVPMVVKPYDEPELSRSIRQLLDAPS